jgi:phosphohistidine phosphatase SixA
MTKILSYWGVMMNFNLQKFFQVSAVILSVFVSLACSQEITETKLWEALRGGGHVALLRHAIAPGTGDPEGFQLGDCSSQRNLSEEGREQARQIGERFREHGIGEMVVYSSQWCRCLDTATLLELGEVTELPDLNSFFDDRSTEVTQTANVNELIRNYTGELSMMLVTHQVNITALTGIVPQSGEMIVLRPDGEGFTVLGNIQF